MSLPGVLAPRTLGLVALWVVVLLLVAQLALFTVAVARRPTNGFVAYYTAARLLRAGVPVARFYDDDWFSARVAVDTPGVYDIYTPNPPVAALLLRPLAGFPYGAARVIWLALSLLLLAIAAVWLIREAGLRGWLLPVFLTALLAAEPLREELRLGQAYLVLLLLLTAAWTGYRRGHDGLLGACLGLALALKLTGLLLLPLLVAQRRWRALAWTAGAGLAVALGSLPWIGAAAWLRFAATLPKLGAEPDLAVTAYQSLPGLIRHLTILDSQWNPGPLLDAPALGRALQLAALLAGVLICAVVARGQEADDLAFAAAVTAGVVFSPLSLDYHYVLLMLPLAILLGWAGSHQLGLPWPALVLALALILVAANFPDFSPRLRDGWPALLAYPKLYGGLLIVALAVWASRRGCGVSGESRADPAWL